MAKLQICPTCSPNFPLASFRSGLAEDCTTRVNICNNCGTHKPIKARRSAKIARLMRTLEELEMAHG